VVAVAAVAIVSLQFAAGAIAARAVGLARPAGPGLRAAIERAAARLGGRPPPSLEVDFPSANAFAFPLRGWMLFTKRLVGGASQDELAAIAGHEMGHLAEPRGVAVARVAPSLALVTLVATGPIYSQLGPIGLLGILCLVLAIILVFKRLSRRMELRADQVGKKAEREPGDYARGLERVYSLNVMPVVLAGRPVHDHLYDRLVTAGVQPGYPRPSPPSRLAAIAILLGGLAICAGLAAGVSTALDETAARAREQGNTQLQIVIESMRGEATPQP